MVLILKRSMMNSANWSCHQSLILTVFFSLPICPVLLYSCIGHSSAVLIHFEAFINLLTSLFPFNNNGPQIHLCDIIPYCHVMFEYICFAQFFLRLHRHYIIIMKSDPIFFSAQGKSFTFNWVRQCFGMAFKINFQLWIFVFSIVFLGI